VTLKAFLALQAAEMVRFALIGDFEFAGVLVENHAAHWVFGHY
jgi:hypothetical protein